MKNLFISAIAAVFLLSSFSVLAQYRDRDGDKLRSQIHKELNLTDTQETKIKELKLANEKEMIELKVDVERKELEMKELRIKGNYSREEFLSLKSELIEAHNKIEMAKASHQMDVYELLNDDQQKIWNEKGMMFNKRFDGKRNFMKKKHNNW